jgi:type IV pilus assembly protein PilC
MTMRAWRKVATAELSSTYKYSAIAPDGTRKKGKLEAPSQSDAIDSLQSEGLIPISVTIVKNSSWNISITRAKTDYDLKLKQDEILVLTRQLYLLLRAGLSIHRAVLVVGEENENPVYVRMCQDLSAKVLSGMPLSKAMSLYPKVFDEVYCAYVAAGESTGDIEKAMERLARVLEQSHQLRLKVKAVTAYPKMVSIAIGFLVYGILAFLVPMYGKIYQGFGKPLPGPTQFLVDLSSSIAPFHINFGIMPPSIDFMPGDRSILTAPFNFASPMFWILVMIFAWKTFRKRTADDLAIGTRIDKIRYRMPMLGLLWKYTMLYRWSTTMAGSLHAGLQTYAALEISGRTAGSKWVESVTIELKEAVRAGRSLATELGKHPALFNAQLRAMAATGEEAGESAEMFANVAEALEDELDAMVATLGARLEVALLMVMGAVVGSLLVVLYLPILNLTKVAGDGYSGGTS